jgi:hypothetical protein
MHRRLLYLAIGLVMAGLILSVPIIGWDFGENASIQDRFQVIGSLLTAVALILGALSFAVLMSVESSDFKALQEFKRDLAKLLVTLNSIVMDEALAAGSGAPRADLSREQDVIRDFLCSTSGFGLTSLLRQKSEAAGSNGTEWRLIQVYLWEAATRDDRATTIASAVKALRLLRTLETSDLEHVSAYLGDMHRGIIAFRAYQQEDTLINAAMSVFGQSSQQANVNEGIKVLGRLMAAGVQDPDIDLWLAVSANDPEALQAALQTGANPSVTLETLLARHRDRIEQLEKS